MIDHASLDGMIRCGLIASYHHVASCGSTNTVATDWLSSDDAVDEKLPRLFVTDQQTKGRGPIGTHLAKPDRQLGVQFGGRHPRPRRIKTRNAFSVCGRLRRQRGSAMGKADRSRHSEMAKRCFAGGCEGGGNFDRGDCETARPGRGWDWHQRQ